MTSSYVLLQQAVIMHALVARVCLPPPSSVVYHHDLRYKQVRRVHATFV